MTYARSTGRFPGQQLLAFRRTEPLATREWVEAVSARLESLKPYLPYAPLKPLGQQTTDVPGGMCRVSLVKDLDFGDTGLTLETPCLFDMVPQEDCEGCFILATTDSLFMATGPLPMEGNTSTQFIEPFPALRFQSFPGVAELVGGKSTYAKRLWSTFSEWIASLQENRESIADPEIGSQIDELCTLTELADTLAGLYCGLNIIGRTRSTELTSYAHHYDPASQHVRAAYDWGVDDERYPTLLGTYVVADPSDLITTSDGRRYFLSAADAHLAGYNRETFKEGASCIGHIVRPEDAKAYDTISKLFGCNMGAGSPEPTGRELVSARLPGEEDRSQFLNRLETALGRSVPADLGKAFLETPEFTWANFVIGLRPAA